MATENNHIGALGSLALASRLRRLLHILQSDGERVYKSLGRDFRVKWFPVLHLLSTRSPLTPVQIAAALRIAHPSLIEITGGLTQEGLLRSRKSGVDGRRREIELTAKGRRTVAQLEPVWAAFGSAGEEATTELDNDFLESLRKLESALERRSMYERIMSRLDGYGSKLPSDEK